MAWNSERPACSRVGIYSTRRTCELLGCSPNTLRKYRTFGMIRSNMKSRYKGNEIIKLWQLHYNGII